MKFKKELVLKTMVLMWMSVFLPGLLYGTEADKIIERVQKKIRATKTIRIQFKEIARYQLTGTVSEVDAVLQMEGKDKFRLESEDQVLVNDGNTFWRYNKLDNQVLVDYAKKEEQEVFLNSFLYQIKEHYYGQVVEEIKEGGKKKHVLKLTPNPSEQSMFTAIKVWVVEGTWEIERIIYTDYNNNETEYRIAKIEFNPVLANTTFSFSPPEGVQVVDLRL